jgi:histidinol-phosphate phosphatase family protein
VNVAAFLDRDGTLIEDAHFLARPGDMRLLPGAAEALRTLTDRGILTIVVTNQSGIARGFISETEYDATRRRLEELLGGRGARLDAQYHCPHHPEVSGPCDCRKPGTGLHRRAARDHDVALDRSLYVGDRRRDVEPALALGGLGILVPSADTPSDEVEWANQEAALATSLEAAVQRYLEWLPGHA